MANRRMFSKKITETDLFLDMPMSAQCLYFHLNMSADDDGFIGNAKTIRRMIGASEDDLKLLFAKEFLIPFENGVVVIKDWKIHNYIRKDTYNRTMYTEEKKLLDEDDNGAYTFRGRDVDGSSPQVRLGKDRLGKGSKDIMSGSPDHGSSADWFPEEREKHADPISDDIPYAEIVSYLNDKADKQYKPTTAKTKSCIKARWNEGFRVKDFKSVVDTKVSDWKENDMSKYLRPETLFGTKFEGYLNEKRGDVHETEYDHIF